MDTSDFNTLLSLLQKPAFLVEDGKIRRLNQMAESYGLCETQEIVPLLLRGQDEYANLQEGSLYLTLSIDGTPIGATVAAAGNNRIFILEDIGDEPELRALALAAMQLRSPMTTLTMAADNISQSLVDEEGRKQLAKLNRSVYQLLRMVSNMSDVTRYRASQTDFRVRQDASAVFGEIFEKASGLLLSANYPLHFENLPERLYCLLDSEKLERAVFNILSNAMKFSSIGSDIHAALCRKGSQLVLTIENEGAEISGDIMQNLFRRYTRELALKDEKSGIGLGMVLVELAAKAHQGTVLVTQSDRKIRTCLSICLDEPQGTTLHSPSFHVDYSGEREHGLVELSDVLPSKLYE